MDMAQLFPGLLFLIVLVVIDVHRVVGSQDDQCRFVFQDNVVLDVEESEGNGAEVVEDIRVDNKIACAEKCCSAEGSWCTLAVFHTQAASDEINCFLIKCVPDGSTDDVCVKRHMKHSGFVSAEVTHHIIHTTPPPKQPTTQPAIKPTTSMPTTQVPSTTTATTTSSTTTTRATTTKATTQPEKAETTTPSSEWISPTEQVANQTSAYNESQPMGTAQNGDGPNEHHDETHGHVPKQTVTQTGILIVTLCFGIIFMLVMLVVMGKRWCEGYKRRKYSKVNYLINGMYS